MSNTSAPDWADLIAKEWVQLIRYVYKHKSIPSDTIYFPIVEAQGRQFANGIDEVFGDPVFDSPDYVLREILKQNTWDFSVAKNYNDVIAINNLLLNEEGALRPWHDFKYEAQKIVGNSTRYLKTEYNTVVASAQMSRLYQEIQRDKHIFPFVQFDVVMDGHTSDICTPLNEVIVTVDDPMLVYYFPPNHFNCRTTLRKLRYGVPTKKYQLPKIPEAFKNNPATSGKIFTDDNRYIANTPIRLLKYNRRRLHKEKEKELKKWFGDTYISKSKTNYYSIRSANFENEVRISKSSIEHIVQHINQIHLQDIVKDFEIIMENAVFTHDAPLENKDPKNYGKKRARGVVSYKYYKSMWKGKLIEINMEVMRNGYEQPYTIIFL